MLNDYWKKDDTQIEVCPRIPYQIVQNLREKDYISQTYFAEYMYTSFGISVHAFATK
jgi:DNA-binding transcriptional regulator YiaG